MAYDERLAERIRRHLDGAKGVTEKAMFGGLAFMLDGNMFVGIMKDGDLMVRIDKADHAKAIAKPHARTMDFTGRPMEGYVLVRPAGFGSDGMLGGWIDWARSHVAAMPAKKPKKRPPPKPAKKARKG